MTEYVNSDLFEMSYEAVFKTIVGIVHGTLPWIKFSKETKLIHCFSFDLDVIRPVVDSITTKYTITEATTPRYMRTFEFETEQDFNAAAMALLMTFGAK